MADHLVPVVLEGPSDIENLVTACVDCNQGKAAKPLGDIPPPADSDAMLASAQELAEQRHAVAQQIAEQRALRAAEAETYGLFLTLWQDIGGSLETFDQNSIRMLLSEGDVATISSAFRIAGEWWSRNPKVYQAKAWRYFCGIAWNLVRGRERKAANG